MSNVKGNKIVNDIHEHNKMYHPEEYPKQDQKSSDVTKVICIAPCFAIKIPDHS